LKLEAEVHADESVHQQSAAAAAAPPPKQRPAAKSKIDESSFAIRVLLFCSNSKYLLVAGSVDFSFLSFKSDLLSTLLFTQPTHIYFSRLYLQVMTNWFTCGCVVIGV
jgi:hypothetical protein